MLSLKYEHRLSGKYLYPSVIVRLYTFLRLSIFPMSWFEELVKDLKGTTLCLGCGYGVLETLLALGNPKLSITASDLDKKRITIAQKSVRGVSNINFQVLDVTKIVPVSDYDVIIFADLLHHLGKGEQEKLLNILLRMLKSGGTLIMKDVDTTPRWKYWWNYVHDSLVAGQPLNYKSAEHYMQYLRNKNNYVQITRYSRWWLPYNHYALIVKKGG